MKRVLAAVALAVSCNAHAQDRGVALTMDSGFYVGASIGRSDTRDFCALGGACDDNDVSWNVFAGYRVNRHFAVEAGYADLGQAMTSGFIGPVASTLNVDTTTIELVGIGSIPFTDAFSLYMKAGFFRYDSDGSGTGGASGAGSDHGTELTLGFGAEYAFSRAVAARLEWQRYFEVGSGVFGIPKADVRVWRLGARYKF